MTPLPTSYLIDHSNKQHLFQHIHPFHNILRNEYNNQQKGMIIETFLSLQDGLYPFDQSIHPRTAGFVQELQYFPNKQRLVSRRTEMQRNSKSFYPHPIIKLLKIYEENLCLHYIYEYVQLSLSGYIRQQLCSDQHQKYKQMTAKLLFRSIVNDITAISNELAKLRVETEFKYEMFGVRNNRIVVFVGGQHQQGRKSEIMLKDHYRSKREGVVRVLQEQFSRIIGELNLNTNGNKASRMMKNAGDACSQSNQSSFWLNDTNFNCETKDTNFKHKEKERRYSQSKWDANQWKNLENQPQKLRNTQSPSFLHQVNQQKPKLASSKHFQDSQEDNFDGRSYCHSKSIRIQLQKNKKKRKDSYKVKVITCHQYQMDDIDPQNLFSKCNLSESSSSHSQAPTRSNRHAGQQQFQEKVKRAATRARDLLNGYLHQRRHTRK